MQLPFAVIPLIHFTSDRKRMGSCEPPWVRALAWPVAAVIVGLNLWLAWGVIGAGSPAAGEYRTLAILGSVPTVARVCFFCCYGSRSRTDFARVDQRSTATSGQPPEAVADQSDGTGLSQRFWCRSDHTDEGSGGNGSRGGDGADSRCEILLASRGRGRHQSGLLAIRLRTAEVEEGRRDIWPMIVSRLRDQSIDVEAVVRYWNHPRARKLYRWRRTLRPDLLVMGAHGHWGLRIWCLVRRLIPSGTG